MITIKDFNTLAQKYSSIFCLRDNDVIRLRDDVYKKLNSIVEECSKGWDHYYTMESKVLYRRDRKVDVFLCLYYGLTAYNVANELAKAGVTDRKLNPFRRVSVAEIIEGFKYNQERGVLDYDSVDEFLKELSKLIARFIEEYETNKLVSAIESL